MDYYYYCCYLLWLLTSLYTNKDCVLVAWCKNIGTVLLIYATKLTWALGDLCTDLQRFGSSEGGYTDWWFVLYELLSCNLMSSATCKNMVYIFPALNFRAFLHSEKLTKSENFTGTNCFSEDEGILSLNRSEQLDNPDRQSDICL